MVDSDGKQSLVKSSDLPNQTVDDAGLADFLLYKKIQGDKDYSLNQSVLTS